LFRALAQVISQNPSLSAIPIDEHSSHPCFVRIPQIDLERVVAFIETEEIVSGGMSTNIDKVLEAGHNRPFVLEEKAAPFWRLVILSSASDETGFAAAFIFHHCLGDGQSGVAFHRCLAEGPMPTFVGRGQVHCSNNKAANASRIGAVARKLVVWQSTWVNRS
jgi:Alcohol acetyltransferase